MTAGKLQLRDVMLSFNAIFISQKHFAEGRLKEAGAIQKDLQLHNVNIASYYTDKYALWLDFRTIDDNRLHGSADD